MDYKKKLTINNEDVSFIMGKCYRYFSAMLKGAYCNCCKSTHITGIIEHELYLDQKNDILIEGKCNKCQSPINRCVETGEKMGPNERAEITRLVKVELLGKETI